MNEKKSLFEQKLILRILSVVAAVILWFAVTYSENPSVTILISNINIGFTGEKSLEENGLIFVGRDKLPGIAVEVRGKRKDVQSILNSVTAKVDLSDITEEGEYVKDITYDVPNPSVIISKKKITSVAVTVEKSVSKEVPVKIIQTGSNKDYIVKSMPKQQKVKITGTTADLSKISAASLSVDISSITSDGSVDCPVVFVDSENNAVTTENKISFTQRSISVENEVYYKKTVRIELSPEYDRDNYNISVKSFSTDKLEVGVKEVNSELEAIYARFKETEGINSDGKYEMTLVIPDGVYCPQPPKTLTMTASIENIVKKEISTAVECVNIADGLTAVAVPNVLTVTAAGTEESLSQLKAVVDLTGLEVGEYSLAVSFTGSASVEGSYNVKVILSDKKE